MSKTYFSLTVRGFKTVEEAERQASELQRTNPNLRSLEEHCSILYNTYMLRYMFNLLITRILYF
jgi:hypothetical protein